MSFHWSIQTLTTVGYGDISAGNQIERVICTFWMIFGVLAYANSIGTIISILTEFDKENEELDFQLSKLNEWNNDVKPKK
jgi:hypothetical protein